VAGGAVGFEVNKSAATSPTKTTPIITISLALLDFLSAISASHQGLENVALNSHQLRAFVNDKPRQTGKYPHAEG
jgi:hypothetical protein